jgi:hypothetical protein
MVTRDVREGISNEEEYFYRANKELIERKRAEFDREKGKETAQERKSLHWMKCPKCGEDMNETELSGIKVDKCSACSGIYFDRGELELLMESREPKRFLMTLRRIFRNE